MITQLEEGEPPNPPRIKADQYWPDRFNYLVCSYLFICLFLTREDRQINLVCFCLFVCLLVCLFVWNGYNLPFVQFVVFSQGEKEMAQSVTFLGGIKVNFHLSFVSSHWIENKHVCLIFTKIWEYFYVTIFFYSSCVNKLNILCFLWRLITKAPQQTEVTSWGETESVDRYICLHLICPIFQVLLLSIWCNNKSFYRKFLLHLPDGNSREVRFYVIEKKLEDWLDIGLWRSVFLSNP